MASFGAKRSFAIRLQSKSPPVRDLGRAAREDDERQRMVKPISRLPTRSSPRARRRGWGKQAQRPRKTISHTSPAAAGRCSTSGRCWQARRSRPPSPDRDALHVGVVPEHGELALHDAALAIVVRSYRPEACNGSTSAATFSSGKIRALRPATQPTLSAESAVGRSSPYPKAAWRAMATSTIPARPRIRNN
jgi:hypothetical protein